MKSIFVITFLLASLTNQAQPSSDIMLIRLMEKEHMISLDDPKMITKGDTYHNQPFFNHNNSLFFTAQQADGNTDILSYNLTTGVLKNKTNTPESEYSAHLTPGGESFVAVQVESDGKQRLWEFDLYEKSSPKVVFENIAPVGYFAINAKNDVLMFVLGSPNSMQLANSENKISQSIAQNIGRTLRVIPGSNDFVYQQNGEGQGKIMKLNSASLSKSEIIDLPAGATDWTITPGGSFLTSSGSQILVYHPKFDKTWREVKDFGEAFSKGVTRMAVDKNGNWLAIVVSR